MSRKMILNRNHTLTSLYGHSVRFEKGVPTHVPSLVQAEALAIGAEFEDGEGVKVEEEKVNAEPLDPVARAEAIYAAVMTLAEKNDVDDFAASGLPKVESVTRVAGFKVSGKDVSKAWQVRADRAAEEKGL
jgi:hypothetical protein